MNAQHRERAAASYRKRLEDMRARRHLATLSEPEKADALASGRWSRDQREALERAGLEVRRRALSPHRQRDGRGDAADAGA